MVDLHWVAAKLIDQEKQKQLAQWRRKHEFTHTMIITTKLQFNGYNCEIANDFADTVLYAVWLKEMESKGFTKPVYERKQADVKPDQNGVVASVTKSEKMTGQGKPMYDVAVDLADGTRAIVLKLNATEFRAQDEVWYFKNAKGYADIQLDFLAREQNS